MEEEEEGQEAFLAKRRVGARVCLTLEVSLCRKTVDLVATAVPMPAVVTTVITAGTTGVAVVVAAVLRSRWSV